MIRLMVLCSPYTLVAFLLLYDILSTLRQNSFQMPRFSSLDASLYTKSLAWYNNRFIAYATELVLTMYTTKQ